MAALVPSLDTSSESKVERVSANLYRLPASTRTFSDAAERDGHELRRAAEATLAAGGTHFVMLPLGGSRPGGAGGDVMLRVINVDQGQEAPVGMLSAQDVLSRLGSPNTAGAATTGLPPNPAFPAEPAAGPQTDPRDQLRGT